MLHPNCERARRWISFQLDGELSEFEHRHLEAHLGHCEGCRCFSADAGAFTLALREAGLEALREPITLPTRGRVAERGLRLAVTAAASAAAVAFVTLFAAGVFDRGLQASTPNFGQVSSPDQANALKKLRLAELKPRPLRPLATHVQPLQPL